VSESQAGAPYLCFYLVMPLRPGSDLDLKSEQLVTSYTLQFTMSLSPSRAIYEPVPVNDLDDNGSPEKLLHGSEGSASPKPALRYWHWSTHLLIFSLYTIFFVAISAQFLEYRSEKLREICLDRQSMHCKPSKFTLFSN
jgi:hypothetical protein